MKVWVTRDEEPGGPLSAALTGVGLDVVCERVISRFAAPDWDSDHVEALGEADLLVLTSVYAIELLAGLTGHRAMGVAVVGEVSRKVAEAAGFRVAFVANDGSVRSLFADLRREFCTGRVCYPRSAQAQEQTSWRDVTVACPILYDTVARDFDRSVIQRVEMVAVASPSAVRAIGSIDLPFASIGPTTSTALGEFGITPVVEAPERSFASLATAIASYASDARHQRA